MHGLGPPAQKVEAYSRMRAYSNSVVPSGGSFLELWIEPAAEVSAATRPDWVIQGKKGVLLSSFEEFIGFMVLG